MLCVTGRVRSASGQYDPRLRYGQALTHEAMAHSSVPPKHLRDS